MKVMILAAGEGRRMRPLTLTTPKPLLTVGGKPLLEHHILNLKAAGFTELVVNAAYLGEQIVAFCGDGSRWGLHIDVSLEPEPLETAGGIIEALPLLGDEPFLVVNGDIWCPFPFDQLRACEATLAPAGAHLVLVDNPEHNPAGDFSLLDGSVVSKSAQSLTFSGIGVYTRTFFTDCKKGYSRGRRPLKPLLDAAIERGVLQGQHWLGDWQDVGTPQRLQALNEALLRG